jgi:phage/plasmid-like protein (TIGR03299 family)
MENLTINEVSSFDTTLNLLEKTGLNWTVSKEPLFTSDGKETESFGIFRSDNRKWLGTVGVRYEPYQNYQLAEYLVGITSNINCEVSRGGMIKEGKKVFMQIELPDDWVGNSAIKRWITALSSHDGSCSIGLGSTNTVVKCTNTFYSAHKDLTKFKHTPTAKDKIQYEVEKFKTAIELDKRLIETYKIMADTRISSSKQIEDVKNTLFGENFEKKYRNDQRHAFDLALNAEREIHGDTIWALFNGVTRYTNHFCEYNDKNEYLMSGLGFKNNLLGYEECLKFVEENSKPKLQVDFIRI